MLSTLRCCWQRVALFVVDMKHLSSCVVQFSYDRTFGNKRQFAKIGIRVAPHSDAATNEFIAPERLRFVHHVNASTGEAVMADASDVAHNAMLQVPLHV